MANDRYLAPYRMHAAQHGTDFGVTGWASPQTQIVRFEVMAEMCPFAGKRVLDAGCSRGDFAAWLHDQRIKYDWYTGIDGLPEIVAFAQRREIPRTDFYHADLIADPAALAKTSPQVVVISGTLNTMSFDEAAQVVQAAWDAASEAVVFNFLSSRCDPGAPKQAPPVYRMDPMRWLDWALDRTWNVVLRQDYFHHGHDATIMMTRTPESR